MVHGAWTTTHGTPSEARRLDVVGRAKRDPQILCQGKRAAAGGGATICRIDLYVVGSWQIFVVEILDMVGGDFFAVKGTASRCSAVDKLLIKQEF